MHPHAAAIAIFESAAFICIYVNAALVAISGFDPTGMPAREAFPDFDAAQAAMDRCYESGMSVTHREPDALMRIRPLWRDGRVWAVATCWMPVQPALRPALDLRLPPSAAPGRQPGTRPAGTPGGAGAQ